MIIRQLSTTTFVIFFVLSALSQDVAVNNFKYILPSHLTDTSRTIGLETHGMMGSNSVNSSMFMNVLFQPSFNDNAKSEFLATNKERTLFQLNADARLSATLVNSWIDEVYLGFNQHAYSSSSSNFAQLALFGNKMWAGEVVRSNELNGWLSTSYVAGIAKNAVDKNGFKFKFNAGFMVASDITYIRAKNVSIFTEANGEYVDAELNDFRVKQNIDAIDGFGLDLGFELSKAVSNMHFFFELENFNPTVLSNGEEFSMDTSFRFSGIVFDINNLDSNGFSSRINDEYNGIYSRNTESKQFVLLPYTVNAGITMELNNHSSLTAKGVLVSLGEYGWSGELIYQNRLNDHWGIRSTAGYGNFSGLYLSQGAEAVFNQTNVFVEAMGLSSLAAPLQTGFLGLRLGLSKSF